MLNYEQIYAIIKNNANTIYNYNSKIIEDWSVKVWILIMK